MLEPGRPANLPAAVNVIGATGVGRDPEARTLEASVLAAALIASAISDA